MQAIFMDIETSGLDPFQHIVLEIAFKIVDLETGQEKACYEKIVKHSWEQWVKSDPMSLEINGFTWDKVQQGEDQKIVKEEIVEIFNRCQVLKGSTVYICQNPGFDRNFFAQIINVYTQEHYHWPYHWLDFASMFWALQVKKNQQLQKILPIEMNLSKNAIAQHHNLPIETMPHGALNGVNHLILCYQTVVGFNSIHNILSKSA